MGKIVLLAMVAAWAAVLIPPLFRSRVDNRPNSSIHDFRRHLSTLQRTVPTRQVAPMRAMARPLAHSGQTRTSSKVNIDGRNVAQHNPVPVQQRTTGTRQHGPREQAPRHHHDSARANHRSAPQRPARRPSPQVSQREVLRRRRTNALVTLVLVTVIALFLAATTQAAALLYVFAVAFVALGVYCYKLVQLRTGGRPHGEQVYRAA